MEEIVKVTGTKILLKTSLSEEGYAKTKFSRHMEGPGYIASLTEKESGTGKITFIPWKFEGAVSSIAESDTAQTASEAQNTAEAAGSQNREASDFGQPASDETEVFFEGPVSEEVTSEDAPEAGSTPVSTAKTVTPGSTDLHSSEGAANTSWKTISSILISDNSKGSGDSQHSSVSYKADRALAFIIRSLSSAIEQGIALPCNGIFGILYNETESAGEKTQSALFLPEAAFDRCAMNLGKESYAIIQEPYRDSNLKGKDALIFQRAVLSYFALTKTLPYPPKTTDKSVDISYRNFIPLEYKINGINTKLVSSVNTALSQDFKSQELRNGDVFHLDIFEEELFHPENRKPAVSAEEFQKLAREFSKKQQKRVKGHKKFNKIKGTIAVAAIFAVFAAIFTLNAMHENSKKPVSTGLSSTETVELFYSGIHTMNTDLMLASAKECPEAQSYISKIPQIYVTANMRAAWNFESGISTPENWMFFEPDSSRAYSHFIFGITNFTIDGKDSTLNLTAPTRRKHKAPLIKENGERLNEFSKSEHKVHYFLVHNVDNSIKVEEYTTVVHLKWKKDRWQISFLDETSCSDFILPQTVCQAYKTVFEEQNQDFIKASLALKNIFPWLPTEQSLVEEKHRLDAVGYF